jgi:hypothetical protein
LLKHGARPDIIISKIKEGDQKWNYMYYSWIF